jgi:hypothetical protein
MAMCCGWRDNKTQINLVCWLLVSLIVGLIMLFQLRTLCGIALEKYCASTSDWTEKKYVNNFYFSLSVFNYAISTS